jgi:hypothetical protein
MRNRSVLPIVMIALSLTLISNMGVTLAQDEGLIEIVIGCVTKKQPIFVQLLVSAFRNSL